MPELSFLLTLVLKVNRLRLYLTTDGYKKKSGLNIQEEK